MSRSRELQYHIHQLLEIRNILNSMKNLAYIETSKLSRFLGVQNQVVKNIEIIAGDLLGHYSYPPLPADKPIQVYILIGSERGFCGDYNETLFNEIKSKTFVELIGVGRKLCFLLEQSPQKATLIDGPNVTEEVPETLSHLIKSISLIQKNHKALILTAIYHDIESNNIIKRQLLPPFQQLQNLPSYALPPVLNMEPAVLLANLIDHYLFAVLHEIFYTSLMAENHYRVKHMEGAVNHLDDETEKLRKKSQTFRQEEITEEIEVILLTAESLL